jgi:RimJ/RimL family protein N-acetyltransferase
VNIEFTSNIKLENDKVLLRPLSYDDFNVLSGFSLNEPELWTYSLIPANGIENLKEYIALALEDRRNEKSYPFLVIDKTSNKVAGSTRFYDYQPKHNTVQLGFTWYGKEFQGTGLNKNCKHLMLKYAFNHLGLDRVEFRADHNNKRSIA